MGHWDQIYQQSRALRAALGGRQARPGHGKAPRVGGADEASVEAVFASSLCPSCLDFTPVGVRCVRCGELGVDAESRDRVFRSPWYLAGVRALRALRVRMARLEEHAADAPPARAATADGWVRLRGHARPVGDSQTIAVLERTRAGGESVVTSAVADFELVDETGAVLVGPRALAVDLLVTDLRHGRWRRELVHGDEVALIADVSSLGEGPHRRTRRQVISSVARPAILVMEAG